MRLTKSIYKNFLDKLAVAHLVNTFLFFYEFYYCIQESPPLEPVLSQMNPV
jgi:hypothetical protein